MWERFLDWITDTLSGTLFLMVGTILIGWVIALSIGHALGLDS
jgi:hypothetical protein